MRLVVLDQGHVAALGFEVEVNQRPTGRARLAARYAHLHELSLKAAAIEFSVSEPNVSREWGKLYPGEPAPLGKRKAARTRWWPEDEVTL